MTIRRGVAAFMFTMASAVCVDRAQAIDRPIATAIERALIEQTCAAVDSSQHAECLDAKLVALRADFGRDLSRFSSAERAKIDAACAPVRAVQGRDRYLECLGSQLIGMQARRSRVRTVNADATPVPASPAAATAAVPSANNVSISSLPSLAVAVAAAVFGAFAVLAVLRARKRRVCPVCATRVKASGDLCAGCRHATAQRLRRATADRIERQRAQENHDRERRQRADDERRRLAAEAEQAERQQQELARRRQEALEQESRRRDAAAAERARQAEATDADAPFDPYTILGVPCGAAPDVVRGAYEQAKTKYDLEQVAGMGVEIQNHYMAKAEAVERAFQLIESQVSS